jgi:hypothetical protein
MAGIESYPQASSSAPSSSTHAGSYSSAHNTSNDWQHTNHHHHHHQPHHRPSLPTLHTRSSFVDGYDQYQESPVDPYTYSSASIPRQDSYASSYGGIENYRSWGSTSTSSGPLSAPITSGHYYEQQHPAYSFGNLQTPASAYHGASSAAQRLPSVTTGTEAFSPLGNMGSLHSSLPAQTAQERRLPVPAPYTSSYLPPAPYSNGEQLPILRPLEASSEPRAHIHGIHSRNAMPWSQESTSNNLRAPSVSGSAPQPNSLPLPLATGHTSASAVSEPSFGYQFTASASPDVSPTSGPSVETYSSAASSASSNMPMPPPVTNYRYSNASAPSNSYELPAVTLEEPQRLPAASSIARNTTEAPQASLYSFSTDNGERPTTSGSDHAGGSETSTNTTVSGQQSNYAVPLRQPQPQHAASVEALRRQSSFEAAQQRAATAHRMSVSNLNGRY